MADKRFSGVPPAGEDSDERALWQALGEIDHGEPSGALRQGFYRQLEERSQPSPLERLRTLLGFSGNNGWLTAAACLLAGLALGQWPPAGNVDGSRLATLEQNVAVLNRQLVLDRLENSAPGKRLRGVMDAGEFAASDTQIARALLRRATTDRVPSVRSAAIDALGPRVNAPAVGEQLMNLLLQAESPIVQLALIDLVLRHGNDAQLQQLLALAEDGELHADLVQHVIASIKRTAV